MTKLAIIILASIFASSAQAGEFLATCEHVTDMAVLAKDNTPYWTANRNSQVQSCYSDIKEFIEAASNEDISQFNEEYNGQIVIYTTDSEFAQHISTKKTNEQAFVIPASTHDKLTPVTKPYSPVVLFQ